MKTTIYAPHADYPRKIEEWIQKKTFGTRHYNPSTTSYYLYEDGKIVKHVYYLFGLFKAYLYEICEYDDVSEFIAEISGWFRTYDSYVPKDVAKERYAAALDTVVPLLKEKGELSAEKISGIAFLVTLELQKEFEHLKPRISDSTVKALRILWNKCKK